MKFSFSQSSVSKALKRVIGAISPRVPMASLSNLYLKLEGNTLEITGTDLEVTINSRLDLVESEGSGGVLIPAKRFQELVNELPDVQLEMELLESGNIKLRGEGIGEYTLPGGNPIEFPELHPVEAKMSFVLSSEDIRRIVSKTIFAVSHDDMRPVLTGLLLQLRPGNVRMVATDGHRLSYFNHSGIEYQGEPQDVIIPMRALNLLIRNLSDDDHPRIGLAESRASFTTDNQELITRLIDGNYPRYESVIPENNSNKLVVQTADFMSAVRRVSIFASQLSRQIKLSIDTGEMKLESEDFEQGGQAVETMPVDYTGDPVTLAYNASYLMDVLKQLDTEEALFELGSADDAALIKPSTQGEDEEFMMLLMPIRLS